MATEQVNCLNPPRAICEAGEVVNSVFQPADFTFVGCLPPPPPGDVSSIVECTMPNMSPRVCDKQTMIHLTDKNIFRPSIKKGPGSTLPDKAQLFQIQYQECGDSDDSRCSQWDESRRDLSTCWKDHPEGGRCRSINAGTCTDSGSGTLPSYSTRAACMDANAANIWIGDILAIDTRSACEEAMHLWTGQSCNVDTDSTDILCVSKDDPPLPSQSDECIKTTSKVRSIYPNNQVCSGQGNTIDEKNRCDIIAIDQGSCPYECTEHTISGGDTKIIPDYIHYVEEGMENKEYISSSAKLISTKFKNVYQKYFDCNNHSRLQYSLFVFHSLKTAQPLPLLHKSCFDFVATQT